MWCAAEINTTAYTHIFGSPQLSGEQLGAAFPLLGAGTFRLRLRQLLRWRKGHLEVPRGEFDIVASVRECSFVGRETPFTQTHGQDCSLPCLCAWFAQPREAERAVRRA